MRGEVYPDPPASWSVETFLSRRPVPVKALEPRYESGAVLFSGSIEPSQRDSPFFREPGFQLLPTTDLRQNGQLRSSFGGGGGYDPATGLIETSIPMALDPLGIGPIFHPGDVLDFRLGLSANGQVASTEWTTFTYDPPPLKLLKKRFLKRFRMRGTKHADRLVGSRRSDRISARSGRDRLRGGSRGDRLLGGRGADRLYGGSGNDLIQGGRGRDVIDCGRGFDLVDVDPKDKTKNCEGPFPKG